MKMKNKEYKALLYDLQVELCKLQSWIRVTGQRVIVIFEGRDSAGKGGTIRAFQERVSKRVFRAVALPTPTDRELTQWYPQRYVQHFPAAGEVILFDRSWYNRAGVERVMGFCTQQQVEHFFRETPNFERSVVTSGIRLIKYWLEIDPEVQRERLKSRIEDPRKHWKLSPLDVEAQPRWYDYSRARDDMLRHTDTDDAPWYIVPANDQRRARLNCIAHFLSLFDYVGEPFEVPEFPRIGADEAYDDKASLTSHNFVPEKY